MFTQLFDKLSIFPIQCYYLGFRPLLFQI
jgi:hypothetical protein